MIVAKTIKIIFVKPSGIGLLIEGDNLTRYQNMHNQAVEAYKRSTKLLEKIKGTHVNIEYEAIEALSIPSADLQMPANKIIIIKDDGTTLLLQNDAFIFYQEHHFQGLKLLKKKEKIRGQAVKVTFL